MPAEASQAGTLLKSAKSKKIGNGRSYKGLQIFKHHDGQLKQYICTLEYEGKQTPD